MPNLVLQQIDLDRRKGFRPDVVGCFVADKKVLLLYKEEHDLWQLPQGGVDNKELLQDALSREMGEELGEKFIKSCKPEVILIGDNKVEFPAKTQGSRDLFTDDGQPVVMKGKKYYFLYVDASGVIFRLKETDFDDYKWLGYEEALNLANNISQKGKKRITVYAIEQLKKLNLI